MLNNVRNKIIAPVAVILVILVVTLTFSIIQLGSFAEDLLDARLESAASSVRHLVDDTRRVTIDVGLDVSMDPRIISVMHAGDRNEIIRVLTQIVDESPDVTWITAFDSDAIVYYRTHDPEAYGDLVRTPILIEALDGVISVAYNQTGPVPIPIRSAVPVIHEGEIIGGLTVARALGTQEFVEGLKERHNAEFVVFVEGISVASTFLGPDGNPVLGTQMLPVAYDRVVHGGQELFQTVDLRGAHFSAFFMPIVAPDGEVLGQLFMALPLDEIHAQRNLIAIISIVLGVVGLVVAVIIVIRVAGGISKPIKNIVTFMNHASTTGDLSLSEYQQKDIQERSQLKDEIGELYRGTASFVMHVIGMAGEVSTVAGGDLSRDITPLSDKDTLGTAIKALLSNLNNMFGEVKSSTMQVAAGSRQVAEGSQALAQGSTEQAASVQQLSSSITEIAQKTRDSADMADKAAMLANDIKISAEKGNRQMDEMMTAVKEINASSQNIGKVIKSIDDIAFQTNILALNAAVEAARAGQHGKGFAVVAEEVRNLAAKSAEAAKNTEGLIADSIEKAELGSRIADETADSLTEIVSGIGEITTIVVGTADASRQQAESISQININIDHVAQVTQENSATAEQSAAASEEMSSQSDMLEEMISRFKMKDDRGFTHKSLPPATTETPAKPSDEVDYGKY